MPAHGVCLKKALPLQLRQMGGRRFASNAQRLLYGWDFGVKFAKQQVNKLA
jgi:hypothetical protein